jgi:hypothetical protein
MTPATLKARCDVRPEFSHLARVCKTSSGSEMVEE